MATELNLSRQSKLVPDDALNEYKYEIFGLGSLGSHVAKLLAKIGAKSLKLYDYDIVEEENLGPQAYEFQHEKMLKTDAMKKIIKDSTGLEVETVSEMVTPDTVITPEPKTIYCCFFDSFEARKMLYDKLKDYDIIFVDGRIGRYDMRHYMVDCSNKEEATNFDKTLKPGKGSELICGEKASAFINYSLTGRIVSNIVAFTLGKPYTKIYIGNALDHTTDIDVKSAVKK